MAKPDLLAEKILGTNPEVGFGEGAVLPYREHHLDTRGFEAMERSRTRKEAQEAEKKKNNDDYFHATIKKLPEARKEVSAIIDQQKQDVVNKMVDNNQRGINSATDREVQQALVKIDSGAKASMQLQEDYDKEMSSPVGKHDNITAKKRLLLENKMKNYSDFVSSGGDPSTLNRPIVPKRSQYFNTDSFLNDTEGKKADITMTNESSPTAGALGLQTTTNKVRGRYLTKDANGKWVRGIGQDHIDSVLRSPTQDPDALQFRESVNGLANEQLKNKALQLKQSENPQFKSMYGDLSIEEIEKLISSNPQDPHHKEFNKDKLQDNIVRGELQKYQTGEESNTNAFGPSYPRPTKGKDDDKVEITRLSDQTRNTTADNNGEQITTTAWHPDEIRLGGKRLDKPIKVNATHIYDEETNHSLDKSEVIGENAFSPSRLMYLPYNTKTGKFEAGNKDAILQKQKKDKNISYKWYVGGLLAEQDPKVPKRKVLIPYDQVQGEMKTGYGFDPSDLTKPQAESDPFKIKEEDQNQEDIL